MSTPEQNIKEIREVFENMSDQFGSLSLLVPELLGEANNVLIASQVEKNQKDISSLLNISQQRSIKIAELNKAATEDGRDIISMQAAIRDLIAKTNSSNDLTPEVVAKMINEAISEALIGAPGETSAYQGNQLARAKGSGELYLVPIMHAALQKEWPHMEPGGSATPGVFIDMMQAGKYASPHPSVRGGLDIDFDTTRLYLRREGDPIVYVGTAKEFQSDKEEDRDQLTAVMMPATNDASKMPELPPFAPAEEKPLNLIHIKKIIASDTFLGSVDNINSGRTDYDPDGKTGWFSKGTDKTLDVRFYEDLMVERVELLMHVPDERTYNIYVGDYHASKVPGKNALYAIDLAEPTDQSGITITFDGNDRNDFNGVYKLRVYTRDEINSKSIPKPKPVVDIVLPSEPTGRFQTPQPRVMGTELMKDPDWHNQFRYNTDQLEGRSESVSTQAQFDELSRNPDIKVAKWTGKGPLKLMDTNVKREHMLMIKCNELNHVRTDGNLAIKANSVVAPHGHGNVLAIGSNVLLDLPDKEMKTGWTIFNWMNKRNEIIENCVWQGGRPVGSGKPGKERVMCVASEWISNNFPEDWEKNGAYDINSKDCGMQAVVVENADADGIQPVLHYDKMDWPKPPHGYIDHVNMFAQGCLGLVTPIAMKMSGIGEQFADSKAGQLIIQHCIMSGSIQNHIGDNSSWGDNFGWHFYSNKNKMFGCVMHAQRGVEAGSGDQNWLEENLFLPPINGYKILSDAGKKDRIGDGGMHHVVSYRNSKTPLSKITQVQMGRNYFVGKALINGHVTRGDEIILPASSKILSHRMNVDGEGIAVPYGVNDKKAGIWAG